MHFAFNVFSPFTKQLLSNFESWKSFKYKELWESGLTLVAYKKRVYKLLPLFQGIRSRGNYLSPTYKSYAQPTLEDRCLFLWFHFVKLHFWCHEIIFWIALFKMHPSSICDFQKIGYIDARGFSIFDHFFKKTRIR